MPLKGLAGALGPMKIIADLIYFSVRMPSLLAVFWLLCLLWTFSCSDQISNMNLKESLLFRDLNSEHRDAIYCAMSFLAENNGPALKGNEKELMQQQKSAYLQWLEAAPRLDSLLEAYEDVHRNWSPVFLEE